MKSVLFNLMPLTLLTLSSLLGLFSNSWMVMWVLLELNVLSFISLKVKKYLSEEKIKTSGTLKYFLIQSMASAVLISSALLLETKESSMFFQMFLILSLMLKIASVPMHRWFVDIVKMMNFMKCFLLLSWQKLLPMVIICFISQGKVLLFVILCAGLTPIEIMNTSKILEILSFSSIFNNSWILTSATMSVVVFGLFTMLYWVAVLSFMSEIWKCWETLKATTFSNISTLTFIANLSSLPPTSGFLAKWFILFKMVKQDLLALGLTLVVFSTVNVYAYVRLCSLKLLEQAEVKSKSNKSLSKIMILVILMTIWFM